MVKPEINFNWNSPDFAGTRVDFGHEKGGSPTPKRSATRFLSYPKFLARRESVCCCGDLMKHSWPLSNNYSHAFWDARSLMSAMKKPSFSTYRLHGFLQASGPDAGAFLQGQFSNDLSSMAVGSVVYGLWLDRKGKIVADSFVLRRAEDRFAVLSYFCAGSVIHERLDAYLVMEEAELEVASGLPQALCVWGEEGQQKVCAELDLHLPTGGGFSASGGVVAFWGRRGVDPCLEIVCLDTDSEGRMGMAEGVLAGLGALERSDDDVTALAIEGRVPQIGRGFGSQDLPQELGLEVDAVSFRKGCYLGQEVMARLHAMGKVRKSLEEVRVESAGGVPNLELPVDLVDENGKRQGSLRSIAYLESGCVGLAVVSSGFGGGALKAGPCKVELLRGERS